MKKILISISVITVLVITLIWASLSISTKNKEIDLRTTVEAKQKKCEAYFDKMWKILKDKAKVSDQYKKSFEEIYPKLIEGRYSKGDGTLMKWITESNPNFNTSLYEELMKSIEIERTGFFNEQAMLIDINREHKALLQKIPSKWFLSDDIKEIKITVITSTKTEKAYETGKDDDFELFEENKETK